MNPRRYQLQMVDENGENRVTMESNFLTKAHLLAVYLNRNGFTGRIIDVLQHGSESLTSPKVIFNYQ